MKKIFGNLVSELRKEKALHWQKFLKFPKSAFIMLGVVLFAIGIYLMSDKDKE